MKLTNFLIATIYNVKHQFSFFDGRKLPQPLTNKQKTNIQNKEKVSLRSVLMQKTVISFQNKSWKKLLEKERTKFKQIKHHHWHSTIVITHKHSKLNKPFGILLTKSHSKVIIVISGSICIYKISTPIGWCYRIMPNQFRIFCILKWSILQLCVVCSEVARFFVRIKLW